LGALGGTPFVLDQLIATGLEPGLYLPVSELKQLRRDMVLDLDAALVLPPQPARPEHPILPQLRAKLSASVEEVTGPWELVALCRTDEQLDALIQSNPPAGTEVELDWMEMVGLRGAVERALKAGLRVILATVRVQKPGEEAFDRRIASLAPHGVLVRHWGGLMHFASDQARLDGRDSDLILHGDFSLNVTNSLTAHHLLSLGLHTVTASHDLNREQLLDLLLNVPRGRIAVTLHHHIPTFHNSHCVYAHLLSSGADYRSCGRPCEAHRIALRDYAGHEHPVLVDVSCRNTVFNALAQSAAPLVPKLLDLGVRRFRVEFVWEQADDVQRTLAAYRQLLAGKKTPLEVLDAARVHERYGVTTPLRIKRERHGP
jgi:putative protease